MSAELGETVQAQDLEDLVERRGLAITRLRLAELAVQQINRDWFELLIDSRHARFNVTGYPTQRAYVDPTVKSETKVRIGSPGSEPQLGEYQACTIEPVIHPKDGDLSLHITPNGYNYSYLVLPINNLVSISVVNGTA